jgi:hypothetical protein
MSSFSLVSATGMLGSGFRAESLDKAISLGARMIGCDAGSTDPGGPGWKPIYIPLSSRRRHLADVLGGNGLVSFCR